MILNSNILKSVNDVHQHKAEFSEFNKAFKVSKSQIFPELNPVVGLVDFQTGIMLVYVIDHVRSSRIKDTYSDWSIWQILAVASSRQQCSVASGRFQFTT